MKNKKNYFPTISGKETDKWVGKLSKIVVPFLTTPEFNFRNVMGGGFLINYNSKLFVVTAKHIKMKYEENNLTPYFLIPFIDQTFQIISSEILNELGNFWMDHQDYDISAISLSNIESVLTNNIIDIGGYPERKLGKPINLKRLRNAEAVILGYPFGDTSNYKGSKNSYFCQKMQGYIFDFDRNKLIFQIRDLENRKLVLLEKRPGGLSGGPIIINHDNEGILIGLCSEMIGLNDPIIQKIIKDEELSEHIDYSKYSNFIMGHHLFQILELLDQF